jgi:hypothetical protein
VRPNAAQRHAGVLGLQHHTHAGGAKTGSQALGDLLGQPLLDLGPGREMLNQPGQLGQPDDALAGQVADVREAGERQQVMLADGAERDGTGQHQLVVPLVVGERRQPQGPRAQQLCVGAGHPGRGLPEILPVEVDP